jgi:Flp pilus assembly protein TadG
MPDRRQRLSAIATDRRGNVALIMALVFTAVLIIMGGVIDVTLAEMRKEHLQAVADAAALSTTTPAAMLNSTSTAQAAATTLWNFETASIGGVSSLTMTVTVTDSQPTSGGTTRNTTVSFSGQSQTFFGALVGYNTIKIASTASATQSTQPYVNIYVLVDNSQSMGIGSTQSDMITLYNLSQSKNNDGCVFGCHVALSGEHYADEALAHSNNVTLRIDSAKSAITTMINQANANAMSTYVKFALYTMGGGDSSSSTLLNQVAALSNNYTSLISSTANIDLETKSAQGVIGDTDLEDALSGLVSQLPATNGNGSSATTPMNFIFIVTDGLDDFDTYNSSLPCLNNAPSPGGYRCSQPIPQTPCTNAKKSVNIGVIYTPYLPLYTNPNYPSQGYYSSYTTLVQPYASTIASNLTSCATNSGFFFSASDGPSIVTAMTELFNKASSYARLTN